VDKDLTEAVKWYQKAATQGMAPSQYNLALLLLEGEDIEKDVKEAMRLLLLCADAGFTQAYYTCARLYDSGENGIEKEPELAVNYLQKAADRGDVHAEYLLGAWTKQGKYVDKDYKEAFRWFQRAAQKGLGDALYMVGVFLDGGLAEAENKEEAVKYYKLAAEKGIPEAQFALGECYEEGTGVGQNSTEAFRCYKTAADQGLAMAQYSVGGCYESGIGVAQDSSIATLYLNKARGQGYVGPVPKSPSFSSSSSSSSESLSDHYEALQKLSQDNPGFMEQMLQQLGSKYPPLLDLLAQSSQWTCEDCTVKNPRGQSCEMCGKFNPHPLQSPMDLIQTLASTATSSSSQQSNPAPLVSSSLPSEGGRCSTCGCEGASPCYVCGLPF